MAKKRKKSKTLFDLLKKTSVSTLIAFLSFILFKLAEPVFSILSERPTQLASSVEPIQFYSNQTEDDLTQLYMNAIHQAHASISIVIFSLLDPQVIRSLQEKCNSGVRVHVVCDAKASPGITQKLPQATIVRRAGKGLTHQKILLVDEKNILVGSSNLTTESLRVHGNLVLGIHNHALGQALEKKIQSMNENGESIPLKKQDVDVDSQHIEFWTLPDDSTAVKRIMDLLKSAKKTIKIAMFTWTRVDFTQEIIQAAKRGVKVEVVLDRYAGKGASAKVVRMLSEAKISVKLSNGKGLLHHKFAYIDDEILINGSTNWTQSAFKVNDDCFVILYPLNDSQKNKMHRLWEVIKK